MNEIEAVIAMKKGDPKVFPGIYSIHIMDRLDGGYNHFIPIIKYSLRMMYSRLLLVFGRINSQVGWIQIPQKPYSMPLLTQVYCTNQKAKKQEKY